jgi:hypothetical protein
MTNNIENSIETAIVKRSLGSGERRNAVNAKDLLILARRVIDVILQIIGRRERGNEGRSQTSPPSEAK